MPLRFAEPCMPPGLEDFPWKHLVHLWDQDTYRTGVIRLRLWYQPSDPMQPYEGYEGYEDEAHRLHRVVWAWLAQRFEQVSVPQFECQGYGSIEDGKQVYRQYAAWGIFSLGERRQS